MNMSNFLPNRIKNLRGWIPETDVDGIDLPKEQVVSETENIVYENGFFRCDKAPIVVPQPFVLGDDETIIDATFFTHSTRGTVYVYVIWDSVLSKLYAKVQDNVDLFTVELAGTIVFGTKPTTINFMEYDDGVRINTNEVIHYTQTIDNTGSVGDGKKLIGNYSLTYVVDGPISAEQLKKWVLTPRWIGWNFADSDVQFARGTSSDPYHPITVADARIRAYDNVTDYTNPVDGGKEFQFQNLIYNMAYIEWEQMNGIGYIKLSIDIVPAAPAVFEGEVVLYDSSFGPAVDGVEPEGSQLRLYTFDQDSGEPGEKWQYFNVWSASIVEIPIFEVFPEGTRMILRFPSFLGVAGGLATAINIYPVEGDITLITTLRDAQRGQVKNSLLDGVVGTVVPIFDDMLLELPLEAWDDRFEKEYISDNRTPAQRRCNMEFYINPIDTRTVESIELSSGIQHHVMWEVQYYPAVTATHLLANMKFKECPFTGYIETMNSRYTLGNTVRVYQNSEEWGYLGREGGIFGAKIDQEIFYNGRAYYVDGTKNIYFSHISGNGRAQPDSFPYSKEAGFGFVYDQNSNERFVNLTATPLDELLLLSKTSAYVYTIQQGQSITYRKLKAVNGNSGISNALSLLRDNTGRPMLEVLVWFDEKGIYAYGGGINQPKNIIERKLENFWRSFHDSTVISAFNPRRNEALFIKGDLAIVLDMATLTWRKIRFSANVTRFLGIQNYNPYFSLSDGTVIYLDERNTKYVSGSLVTHYSTNYAIDEKGNFIPLSELTDKILHELYVSMHKKGIDTGAPIGLLYDIIVDGNVVEPSIYFSGQVDFAKVSSPLLIRYRKIKIRITISASDNQVGEIGYEYSVKRTYINNIDAGISNKGFGSGFGNDFGVRL
jgi:hypothetical protein